MNKYERLLSDWCGYLLSVQQDDGGFGCEACGTEHGRADNAVFPLVYEYFHSADVRFLLAAKELLNFRKKLEHDDGSVQNDFTSEWKGITVFSAINLYKTLKSFGEKLPQNFKKELEICFKKSGEWVHKKIKIGFRANINYYAAAAAVNAMYGRYFCDEKFIKTARILLDYCMKNFTGNGLLSGEGQPHDFRTEKGCAPVDIGYNVEESLPCLVDAAKLLHDEAALDKLTEYGRKILDFMLPDGGWDNSFGVRNNKWTYYGSRTSDGCIAAFAELGKRDPIFYEAAERTFEILSACTRDGRLYGGRSYPENGQPPCVHHTFCHGAVLADFLCSEIPESLDRQGLPCDEDGFRVRYYPEIDTYKIHAGEWLATVTGYDYSTYTYSNGAAHASGGAISLLYGKKAGTVIAGSVYEYRLTEQNNMQLPAGNVRHATLIPRAEYEKNGVKYATCLDGNAKITVTENRNSVTVRVKASFVCAEEKCSENDEISAEFFYEFLSDSVTVFCEINQKNSSVKFVLPVVKNSAEILTRNPYKKEEIFFLTGGFAADEYTFDTDEKITVKIRARDKHE